MSVAVEHRALEVVPQTGFTGAEIRGVDLSAPLGDDVVSALRQAILRWKVIFVRDQHLDDEKHLALLRRFGEPLAGPTDYRAGKSSQASEVFSVRYEYPPFDEQASPHVQQWHVDGANSLTPPSIVSIRVEASRSHGGDTNFSNLTTAYETLPAKLRAFADTARSINRYPPHLTRGNRRRLLDLERNPLVAEHPVVRVHPETGERTLFVEPTHAIELAGLTPRQGRYLLEVFFDEINKPEHVFRLRWHEGTIALWDNRAVAHYAPNDLRQLGHQPEDRKAYRISLRGDVPVGVDGRPSRQIRGPQADEESNGGADR